MASLKPAGKLVSVQTATQKTLSIYKFMMSKAGMPPGCAGRCHAVGDLADGVLDLEVCILVLGRPDHFLVQILPLALQILLQQCHRLQNNMQSLTHILFISPTHAFIH